MQSNKLEKIPAGALNNLQNLRELYLQNNLLTNEGMDSETFRWKKRFFLISVKRGLAPCIYNNGSTNISASDLWELITIINI